MNEQIKKLAEQAYEDVIKNTPSFLVTKELYEQKFAELIVRECLEQIDKIRDGCEDDGEDQQALGADWAGLAVARHFGVEE